MIGLMILAAAPVCAGPAPFDGSWTAQVPSPNGESTFNVVSTFKVDGSKLTGTVSLSGGKTFDLVDTAINDDRIAFRVDGESSRFTGTLAGDEIKMQVTYTSGERGTRRYSFVAKRATAGS